MKVRIFSALCVVFLAALILLSLVCTSEKLTPLTLQIIQPVNNDTLHSDTIPVEGIVTVDASVYIGATDNPSTPVTPDANGHFTSHIIVEDLDGPYAICIRVKMDTRDFTECRQVYYKRGP